MLQKIFGDQDELQDQLVQLIKTPVRLQFTKFGLLLLFPDRAQTTNNGQHDPGLWLLLKVSDQTVLRDGFIG